MNSRKNTITRLSTCTVEESVVLTGDTCRISVRYPEPCEAIAPGQFFMIRGWDGNQPFLRRPFSVSDMDGEILSFLIKVTGKGTKLIADHVRGESLSLLGPLGNGFNLHPEMRNHVFVAGGIGIAPFPLLEKSLKRVNQACEIELFYGERSAARLLDMSLLGFRATRLTVSTEDGSFGHKGLVTELLTDKLRAGSESTAVYACGPNAMLKAVQDLGVLDSIPLQFSMESFMGCGMGSCMGCVIRVSKDDGEEYNRVCSSGPVFEGREVIF